MALQNEFDNKGNLYYNYDESLEKYLKSEKGIDSFVKARAISTHDIFTMYRKTDDFLKIVREYYASK